MVIFKVCLGTNFEALELEQKIVQKGTENGAHIRFKIQKHH